MSLNPDSKTTELRFAAVPARTTASTRVMASTKELFEAVFRPPGFNAKVDEVYLVYEKEIDADLKWKCAESRQYGTDARDNTPWVAIHFCPWPYWADVLRVTAVHLPNQLYFWKGAGVWEMTTDLDPGVWLEGDFRYRTILNSAWKQMVPRVNYKKTWKHVVGLLTSGGHNCNIANDGTDNAMRQLYEQYESSGCQNAFDPMPYRFPHVKGHVKLVRV